MSNFKFKTADRVKVIASEVINIILDTSTGVYYYDFKSAADTIGLDKSYFMKIMKGLYNNRTPYKLV